MLEAARFVNLVLAGLLAGHGPGLPSAPPLTGVRTDDTPKLLLSATVGREPKVEVALD